MHIVYVCYVAIHAVHIDFVKNVFFTSQGIPQNLIVLFTVGYNKYIYLMLIIRNSKPRKHHFSIGALLTEAHRNVDIVSTKYILHISYNIWYHMEPMTAMNGLMLFYKMCFYNLKISLVYM